MVLLPTLGRPTIPTSKAIGGRTIQPVAREGTGSVSGGLHVEGNALGEREIRRVVDRVRHAAHVGFPSVGAGLAAAAGDFFAAERAADLRAARANVDVGDAAVAAGRREEFFR